MSNLRRVRLDPQGLITQDERGIMQRIALPADTINMYAAKPERILPELSSAHPPLQKLLGSGEAVRVEAAMEQAGCLNRPLRFYFGLEPRCNLNCSYCGPRDFHDSLRPASPEDEDFILRQIAESGAFQVQLTGGEVCIRGMELVRLVRRTRELGLAVLLSTNGVWNCIDRPEEFLDGLAAMDNIIQAKISIEGTPEFHDSVRGRGSYNEAVKTLARLSERRLNPRISTTIFAESCNEEQLRHLVGLAEKYGAGFQPIPVRPIGRASTMTLRPPSLEQLTWYTQELTRIRAASGVSITFNFDIFSPVRPVPVFDLHRPCSCGAPLWGCHITHTGEVFACGFAQEADAAGTFLAGKVSQERSLLDIWLHSEVLRRIRDAGKSETCRACSHYGNGCWGGCWVMAWLRTGRTDGMDPYCLKR